MLAEPFNKKIQSKTIDFRFPLKKMMNLRYKIRNFRNIFFQFNKIYKKKKLRKNARVKGTRMYANLIAYTHQPIHNTLIQTHVLIEWKEYASKDRTKLQNIVFYHVTSP